MQIRAALLVQEGIAGAIRDGGKEFGLLHDERFARRPILPYPMIVISTEDYTQLERLARRGEPMRIEADIKNTFTPGTIDQYNTVAEIRGTEKPTKSFSSARISIRGT